MKLPILIICFVCSSAFAVGNNFQKNCYIKPCEIKGDFDGDKKPDSAILVVNKKGQKGIQFRFANKKIAVIGAGDTFGNGGDSFDWMDRWSLQKNKIEQGADESEKPPVAKGDALLLEKVDAASGLAYWDGSKFNWYQQGD